MFIYPFHVDLPNIAEIFYLGIKLQQSINQTDVLGTRDVHRSSIYRAYQRILRWRIEETLVLQVIMLQYKTSPQTIVGNGWEERHASRM